MALLNYDEQNQMITVGSRYDACIICANEFAKKERLSIEYALSKLSGTLENKKVLKFTHGRQNCICAECIAKFNAEMNPVLPVVEESKDDTVSEDQKSKKKEGTKNEKAKTTK